MPTGTVLLGGAVSLVLMSVLVAFAISRSVDAFRSQDTTRSEPAPPLWRHVWWLVRLIAVALGPMLGPRARSRIGAGLRQAGLEFALRPEDYAAGVLLCALLGAGLGSAIAASASLPVPPTALACAATGFLWPGARMRDRIRTRRRLVLRHLPFVLDLVTIAVQAGLSPSAAIAQAVSLGPPGPLRDEMARVLRDVKAGRSRNEAMRMMVERLGLAPVGSFAGAIESVDRTGGSLARLLRAQSEQRRSERFLAAEKAAMEAPVKLILPLVVFIFPGTFAIILFPIASQLADALSWR